MKRYLAPLLILAVLLLAGSFLWLRSSSVPAADTGSQAESDLPQDQSPAIPEDSSTSAEVTDPNPPAAPDRGAAGDDSSSAAAEPTPAGTDASESMPSDSVPAGGSASQPSAASQPAPAETPSAKPSPVQEQPPAASAEDPAAMVQDLLAEINKERAGTGAAPLTLDAALSAVAQLRAQECTIQFGHTRPDGTTYRDAVADAGLSYQHLGENLASGHTTARAVVQNWNDSDPHHDNLVSETFTKVGIGLAKNTDGKYGGYSWAVLFTD